MTTLSVRQTRRGRKHFDGNALLKVINEDRKHGCISERTAGLTRPLAAHGFGRRG